MKEHKHTVSTNQDNKMVTIWSVSYEIRSEQINGTIDANYILHQTGEDVTPELIRGFSEFVGTINGQYGQFIAQEDGRTQNNLIKINGRIIDASDGLSLLVGRYYYDGLLSESVYEVNFDIEL